MHYDFDAVTDRNGTYAMKLEEMEGKFGRRDILPLWVADMDFKTAQPILDSIVERANQGIFGYTARPEEYFRLLQDWQARRNDWSPDPALMSFSPGVIPSMIMASSLLFKEGDAVIIQPPVYPPFFSAPNGVGLKVLENTLLETSGGYVMDFEDFAQKAREAKLFYLCSPHNPVGRCWTREELVRIGNICLENDVLVIADEIHADLIMPSYKHIPFAAISPEFAANTITLTAASKTFNLAGLQSSTVIWPNAEMKAMYDKELSRIDTARNNCFSLVATMAAYRQGEEWLEQLISYVRANMDYVRAYCEENIPEIQPNNPEATYLLWMDARKLGLDNAALKDFLVNECGIAANPGESFGVSGSGFFRMNLACPRSIVEKAMKQIGEAVAKRRA